MMSCSNNPISAILKCMRATCCMEEANNAVVVSTSYNHEMLQDAIVDGNQTKLKRLLKRRQPLLNIDQRDADGETLLSLACLKGNASAALLLLKHGANIDEGVTSPLLGACKSGNRHLIRLLLDRGANVNDIKDDYRGNPFIFSVKDADILQWFLDHGADVNASNSNEETLLSLSCIEGSLEHSRLLLENGANVDKGRTPPIVGACKSRNQDLIRLLLDRGANINNIKDDYRGDPFIFSVKDSDILQLFLDHGADVNARDSNEETLLSLSCIEGTLELSRLLLENGANIDKGRTLPIVGACKSRNRDLIRLLLDRGANVNDIKDNRGNPFIFSVEDVDILRLFLDHGANLNVVDRNGRNLLFYANSADAVHLLLDRGLQLESTDSFQRQPLHQIASPEAAGALIDLGARIKARDELGNTPLHYPVGVHYGYRYEVMRELVNNGADVNAESHLRETPLHYAFSWYGEFRLRVVMLLLDHGARIDARNYIGETPLHKAFMSRADLGIIELLLDRGADVLAVSHSLQSPLHYACNSVFVQSDVVQLLLDRGGADAVNVGDELGNTPLHSLIIGLVESVQGKYIRTEHFEVVERKIKLLVSRGANINAKNKFGQTPLSLNYCKAVKTCRWSEIEIEEVPELQIEKVIGWLTSLGAGVNVLNDQGLTMLQAICGSNSAHCSEKTAKLAIERGADLDAQNGEGRTALHLACMDDDKVNVARVLLEQGASTGIQDNRLNTPLHLACFKKCWAAVRLLLEFGANPMTKNICGECAVHTIFLCNDSPFDLLYLAVRECPDQLAFINK